MKSDEALTSLATLVFQEGFLAKAVALEKRLSQHVKECEEMRFLLRKLLVMDGTTILPVMMKRVDELELTPHVVNPLLGDNILYVYDLIRRTETELIKTPNLGRKRLNRIKEVLALHGLWLGMKIEGWRPPQPD